MPSPLSTSDKSLDIRLLLLERWLEKELLELKAQQTPLNKAELQSLQQHQTLSELQTTYQSKAPPLLSQRALLRKIHFFDRLSEDRKLELLQKKAAGSLDEEERKTLEEHDALDEFNTLYQQALATDAAQQIRKHSLKGAPLKHYLNLRIEGEDYPEQQKARWQQQHSGLQAPDGLFHRPTAVQKLRGIQIALPQSILKLSANALLRLAFSSKGRYFYHFLNQHINDAIQQQANRNDQPLHDFYAHLNRLSRDELYQELRKNPAITAPLYSTLVSFYGDSESELAYTDGKPLDYLVGECVFWLLRDGKNKEQEKSSGNPDLLVYPWSPDELELIHLAAKSGSFKAALFIKHLLTAQIKQGQNLEAIFQPYLDYVENHFASILNRHKAAGALLLVGLQQVVIATLAKKISEPNRQRYMDVMYKHMCYALTLTETYEATHKNALRASSNSDDCRILVQQVYAKTRKQTAPAAAHSTVLLSTQSAPIQRLSIDTTGDAIEYLHDTNQHLRDEFSKIRSYSPNINKKSGSFSPGI